MGKPLLTSSQVSVLLTTTIVATFTLLLFLCGYTLQQQNIRILQVALQPRIPVAPPSTIAPASLASNLQASRAFGGSLGSNGRIAFQSYIGDVQDVPVDWNKLAHVQLVKEHTAVCNAIMLFGELHRLKSPARRILLFPRTWALEKTADKGDAFDPYMTSTRRLLKLAARRYRAELRPIEPLLEGADEDAASSYSLASAYNLRDVSRAMLLSTPGLMQDATLLDSLLAYAPGSPLALLQKSHELGLVQDDLMLITPGEDTYAALRASSSSETESDISFVQGVLPEVQALESTTSETHLIRSIGSLHNATVDFNATAFLATAGYIRFSDPKRHGPEFEVPYSDVVRARPQNKDADWTWTKLYGLFAQRRFEICGLDLEPWREY